ncbi:MAG: exonuclease domain-containing protein, partial [Dehalococcoidia bacterium]
MSAYTDNLPNLSNGYCIIDTETSGLNPNQDRVIELSVLIHVDGASSTRTSLLNSVPEVPQGITNITGITTSMLQTEGRPPAEVFKALFEVPEVQTLPIVGHNLVGFDRPFLLREAQRLTSQGVNFWAATEALKEERLVDTGALYKGIQLEEPPRPGEDHFTGASRVLEIRAPGLYWNLRSVARAYGVSL